MNIRVKLCFIDGVDPELPVPKFETDGAVCMDISAHLVKADRKNGILIKPLERKLIGTGLRVELPHGYEMQVRPRSGLALKYGITVLNSPGTIDADYRGEIGVLLINLGTENFKVSHFDRIAQIAVSPVIQILWQMDQDLSETNRGVGGYGSTGVTVSKDN